MAKQKLDSITELTGLLQQREAVKSEALAKLYKAKAEAEEKLNKALCEKKDAVDDFDVEAFINGSTDLNYLPGYIADLNRKISELQNRAFGQPFDTFMQRVAALSQEENENFEKEFTQLAAKLNALCKENIAFSEKLHGLESRWLCDPMACYSQRSGFVNFAAGFLHNIYNYNVKIEGYDPFV